MFTNGGKRVKGALAGEFKPPLAINNGLANDLLVKKRYGLDLLLWHAFLIVFIEEKVQREPTEMRSMYGAWVRVSI